MNKNINHFKTDSKCHNEEAAALKENPFCRRWSLTVPSLVRKYLGDRGRLSPLCALCRRWPLTKMQTGDTTFLDLGRYSD